MSDEASANPPPKDPNESSTPLTSEAAFLATNKTNGDAEPNAVLLSSGVIKNEDLVGNVASPTIKDLQKQKDVLACALLRVDDAKTKFIDQAVDELDAAQNNIAELMTLFSSNPILQPFLAQAQAANESFDEARFLLESGCTRYLDAAVQAISENRNELRSHIQAMETTAQAASDPETKFEEPSIEPLETTGAERALQVPPPGTVPIVPANDDGFDYSSLRDHDRFIIVDNRGNAYLLRRPTATSD